MRIQTTGDMVRCKKRKLLQIKNAYLNLWYIYILPSAFASWRLGTCQAVYATGKFEIPNPTSTNLMLGICMIFWMRSLCFVQTLSCNHQIFLQQLRPKHLEMISLSKTCRRGDSANNANNVISITSIYAYIFLNTSTYLHVNVQM